MRARRFAKAFNIRRAAVILLMAVCAALLLTPLLGSSPRRDVYAGTGRGLVLPEVAQPGGIIAVNTADLEELTELPGVGETIAQYIIDERESRGPFRYPEDLLAVRGIGEKTLESLRDWLDMTLPEDGE